METICSKFLWSGTYDIKKMAIVAWGKVSQPLQNGGMGIKEVLAWNKALCAKWIWKLTRPATVFTKWAKAYLLCNDDILRVMPHGSDACGGG